MLTWRQELESHPFDFHEFEALLHIGTCCRMNWRRHPHPNPAGDNGGEDVGSGTREGRPAPKVSRTWRTSMSISRTRGSPVGYPGLWGGTGVQFREVDGDYHRLSQRPPMSAGRQPHRIGGDRDRHRVNDGFWAQAPSCWPRTAPGRATSGAASAASPHLPVRAPRRGRAGLTTWPASFPTLRSQPERAPGR